MTQFQALFIKLLRCRYKYTYRAVYNAYVKRYPKIKIRGSVAYGEYLVALAEVTLGENPGAFDEEYKHE